jgi:hypothetical protein
MLIDTSLLYVQRYAHTARISLARRSFEEFEPLSRRSWLEKPSPLIAERLLEHDSEIQLERRDRTRIQAREAASISGVHSRVSCDAIITDVSTRGIRLIASEPFPAGASVIVEWARGFVPCTVRHFRPTDEGWVIGVEAEWLPGVLSLMEELKRTAQQRNRSILLP